MTNSRRVAVDTNILVYAEDYGSDPRSAKAVRLFDWLGPQGYCVPVQVAGEFMRVLTRKGKRSPARAEAALSQWSANAEFLPTTAEAFCAALDLMTKHKLDIWDAVILSVSAESGCSLLLSEDMQDGFVWRGLTIVNPFAGSLHPLLQSAIDEQP